MANMIPWLIQNYASEENSALQQLRTTATLDNRTTPQRRNYIFLIAIK